MLRNCICGSEAVTGVIPVGTAPTANPEASTATVDAEDVAVSPAAPAELIAALRLPAIVAAESPESDFTATTPEARPGPLNVTTFPVVYAVGVPV